VSKKPRTFSVDPQAYDAFHNKFGKDSSGLVNRFLIDAVKGEPKAVEIIVGMYDEKIRVLEDERDQFMASSMTVIERKQDERTETALAILRERMATWFSGDGNVPENLNTLCGWVKRQSGLDASTVKSLIRAHAKTLTSESVWLDYVDDRLMGVSE
jgi:hypothetical protein